MMKKNDFWSRKRMDPGCSKESVHVADYIELR
jgi:hypothetical protein